MWILMRSHKRYQLYRLSFDIQDLESQWQDCWCVTASDTMEQQPSLHPSELDLKDVTEAWLEYLLRPGRYPETVLETALSIYRGDSPAGPRNAKASLKERLFSAIVSRVDTGTAGLGFEEYRSSTHHEWTVLHQDIQESEQVKVGRIVSLLRRRFRSIPGLSRQMEAQPRDHVAGWRSSPRTAPKTSAGLCICWRHHL